MPGARRNQPLQRPSIRELLQKWLLLFHQHRCGGANWPVLFRSICPLGLLLGAIVASHRTIVFRTTWQKTTHGLLCSGIVSLALPEVDDVLFQKYGVEVEKSTLLCQPGYQGAACLSLRGGSENSHRSGWSSPLAEIYWSRERNLFLCGDRCLCKGQAGYVEDLWCKLGRLVHERSTKSNSRCSRCWFAAPPHAPTVGGKEW